MEQLKQRLLAFIKSANQQIAAGNLKEARNQMIHAAECALLLAKNSFGKEQQGYLEQYKVIKQSIDNLAKKIDAESAAPTAAAKKDAPREKAKPDATPKDTTPKPVTDNKRSTPKSERNDALSPRKLEDYIGQPDAVTAVRDLINAALLKNTAMPHIILYGSHGLGKTTFSHIIANELHAGFIEVNVSKITPQEMISILKKLQPRDVVFIDEIHTLPLVVAESVLYSAMQDGKIVYTEGKGEDTVTQTLELPPFTLIGATTEIGKLAKPFTQRAIQIRLVEYTDEVLANIIGKSFYKLGTTISDDDALYISKRCRNNPRIANNMVKRICDKALVRYASQNALPPGSMETTDAIRKLNITVSRPVIDEFFKENGIDEWGLENGDRELLRLVITRYNGGPVGLDNLARTLNESNNVITQKYEAYLIKKGLYKVERDGRSVTPEGYKVLGLPVPEKLSAPEKEEEKPPFEVRNVVAASQPDTIKCEKMERLITYPENAALFSQSLDELFPDIKRDDETNHRCAVEVDFGTHKRRLVCDSYLESQFAQAMAKVGFLQDIKAQTVELSYVSQTLANKRYFPDFVIKDYKGRVVVIEMKNYEMMSFHLNVDKYFELKTFCARLGYGYAEIARAYGDETYTSFEDLLREPVNEQLQRYVHDDLEQKKAQGTEAVFGNEDFEEYCRKFGQTDIRQIYTLLLNDRKLKNTDRVGGHLAIVPND